MLMWPVSAATGAGVVHLVRWVGRMLLELPVPEGGPASARAEAGGEVLPQEGDADHVLYRPEAASRLFVVEKEADGRYRVEGTAVRRLVSRFDLSDYEAVRYLGERLERLGVYAALRAKGAQPGDGVEVEGYDFEFQ